MAKVYIGTSGWVYGDWSFDYVYTECNRSAQDKLNYFYPPKLPKRKWLQFYSQNFKTVEINATFYHQMKPATFENWAKVVPDGFVFAVKASRFITHIKRLRAPKDSLKIFFESVSQLGDKLGPILWQLPPRFRVDAKRLEKFLELALHPRGVARVSSRSHPGGEQSFRLALEFRDPSWFNESIYKILRKYNAALVIAESGNHWPSAEVITTDFTYLRFHGEGGSYASKYTDDELKVWAGKIKKWQKAGIDVYAYFNNDVGAFAVENAVTLSFLLSKQP